ncbi:hypothetical protein Pyn_15210 [Prunus yedoensis var. nudiflora]|uniref:Uncharacterized protein n=1 Tax=Prunus yedoensis var. nudiflora TaxID=2094558 RepID=A0A314XKK8_PRUYE|nr:hypothetical protein Pyn_15210 [Prunus yedoensis var. nudiflora]
MNLDWDVIKPTTILRGQERELDNFSSNSPNKRTRDRNKGRVLFTFSFNFLLRLSSTVSGHFSAPTTIPCLGSDFHCSLDLSPFLSQISQLSPDLTAQSLASQSQDLSYYAFESLTMALRFTNDAHGNMP